MGKLLDKIIEEHYAEQYNSHGTVDDELYEDVLLQRIDVVGYPTIDVNCVVSNKEGRMIEITLDGRWVMSYHVDTKEIVEGYDSTFRPRDK